ncbi:MAG: insulinase family protein, partial [Burkholderiaceae bacterium]|nr:insulinase family protein [Burkholderiaceae bacterium]
LRAEPGVDEPPPAAAPRPLVLPALHQFTLANDLVGVVAPRPGLPLVSLTLLVRAGAEADPPGRPGVAAMTSALWPRGALRDGAPVSASALARQAEALGSALEARSSFGAGTLAMTVTTPRADAALALMADALRRPLLAADELERARAQALDGLRVTLGNPGEVSALVLRRAFWGPVPHGAVAPPAALQRLQRTDLQAFQSHWVRPDRVALVLAGDITPAAGEALARRLLGDWRAPANAPPQPALAPPAPLAQPLVLVDLPGAGQTSVAVAAPFVASGAADRRIGLVAQAVLGGGYSARLMQAVRIRRGLSYDVAAAVESFAPGGMFSAQAQTHHPNAAEVLQLLRSELVRLADEPPAAAELAARQATLVGNFGRRFETNDGVAALIVGQLAQGRPLADLADHVPALLAVTPAQVRDFARAHWPPDSLRAVVVGDLAATGDALAALAPQALKLTMAELDLEAPALRKP